MSGLVVLAALAAAVAIGALAMLLHRAARLERLLEEHDRAEADLEAMTLPEDRACGCRWVPCDEHIDRLMRIIRKDGEQ